MVLTTLEIWFIWVMIYSIVGWIYESILCSVSNKKLINRGFLNGPYCPIYGNGALIVILLLGKVTNPILLFILGAVLTCALEYATSYLMEKLFNARWWDYSSRKFNINGRICLIGAIVFGIFSVVLILILHPIVQNFTNSLSDNLRHLISATLFIAFLIDCIITIKGFSGFNKKLEEFAILFEEQKDVITEKIHAMDTYQILNENWKTLKKKFNVQQCRMIKAFPLLKTNRNNDVLIKIRTALKRK
ncbi:MAG: hypothetical protein RSE93_01895 [Oscillospiraceae bacterium]